MVCIDVRQLSQDIARFHWDETAKALGLDAESACQTPIVVDVIARKIEDRVIVEGRIVSRAVFMCSRCLDSFESPVEADVRVEYREGPRPVVKEDVVKDDDGDVSYYDHPTVDLADDLRQMLLLASPAYPLCGETCRGLCPVCGTNLNTSACSCTASEGSDTYRPFGELGKLLRKTGRKKKKKYGKS